MKWNFHILSKQAKYLWLWLLRKDILIFLLFVGLVTVFWWGRTLSSPRDLTISIPVTYSGINQQVVFEQTLPQHFHVTIRDNGKQLRQIKKNGNHLDYDLRPLVSENDGQIVLSAENLRQKLQDILPGSTKIQNISPEYFSTNYHKQAQKTVAVRVQENIRVAPQHQLVGTPTAIPDSIQLFGSQEIIDSITYIPTSVITIDQLRDSATVTASLLLPQGIRASHDQVKVHCQAEQFTEKSFTLPISIKDIPDAVSVRLFPQVVEVVARVGVSHFTQVQDSDIQAYCNYPQEATDALNVHIQHTNPYISNIRISPEKVEYMINQ